MKINEKPNQLIREKSPYLLQCALFLLTGARGGEEAFEKEKQENSEPSSPPATTHTIIAMMI